MINGDKNLTRWEKIGKRPGRSRTLSYRSSIDGTSMFGIIAEVDRAYQAWLKRRGLKDDPHDRYHYGKGI